ncbi:unnamed protein product [Cyprideis torosa]|uniref:Uncharacterized protein n=1 Tax=Cyprideis torosa TaxID=163714 RepID=A0A7R8WXA8_9CRUS|nr:unnamed protein product [Cyprideis torosa]CAG0912066.1 unnamed protein product [Cyprideis torosa]
MADVILALTTWPDEEGAADFARHLLENGLAACVNIAPAMRSYYVWQGKINVGTEHQLLIKTTRQHQHAIESALQAEHPYELAEFLVLPIASGSEAFLNWIHESTHAE